MTLTKPLGLRRMGWAPDPAGSGR